MKYFILIFALTVACAAQDRTKDSIDVDQQTAFTKDGKYKHVSPKQIDDRTVEIHSYVAPKGKGWIEIWRAYGAIRTIDRRGFAKYREHDWKLEPKIIEPIEPKR